MNALQKFRSLANIDQFQFNQTRLQLSQLIDFYHEHKKNYAFQIIISHFGNNSFNVAMKTVHIEKQIIEQGLLVTQKNEVREFRTLDSVYKVLSQLGSEIEITILNV